MKKMEENLENTKPKKEKKDLAVRRLGLQKSVPIWGLRGRYSFKDDKSNRLFNWMTGKFERADKDGIFNIELPPTCEGYYYYNKYKVEYMEFSEKRGKEVKKVIFKIPRDVLLKNKITTKCGVKIWGCILILPTLPILQESG